MDRPGSTVKVLPWTAMAAGLERKNPKAETGALVNTLVVEGFAWKIPVFEPVAPANRR